MGLGITRGWREIRGDDYMVVVRIKMVGDIRRKGLLGLVTDHVKGCGKRDREHPVSKVDLSYPTPNKDSSTINETGRKNNNNTRDNTHMYEKRTVGTQ